MLMVDGNLTLNLRTVDRGVSARAYVDGYWGFGSEPLAGAAADRESVQRQALANARALAGFGARAPRPLPAVRHVGRQQHQGRTPLTPAECNERLAELHAWCRQRFPGLRSTRFLISDEHHGKALTTSLGGDSFARIDRAACMFTLVGEDATGAPIEVDEWISGRGTLADVDWSLGTLAPKLEQAHEHLQAKRNAVTARGGHAHGGAGRAAGRHAGARGHGPPVRGRRGARRRRHRVAGGPAGGERAGVDGRLRTHLRAASPR